VYPGILNHMITGSEPDLLTGLRSLGLQAGMGVVVHSSLRSFGHIPGGAPFVISTLMEVLTEEGTILMPSFNHNRIIEPGWDGYYHPGKTSTINGIIPDTFWRMPGVLRSLDPTHAVAAWGKHAARYTRNHHRTLTMSPDSPLGLLGSADGYGLLIGVGYAANTYHHVVETSTGAPCLGKRTEAYPVVLADGRRFMGRTWGWRGGECPFTDHGRYPPEMARRGLQRVGTVGSSQLILFRLSDCFDVVSEFLMEGAAGYPPCHLCSVRPRSVPQTVESDWDAALDRLMPDSAAWRY
jgi:aminoglycoside N3'-acetyltransferase